MCLLFDLTLPITDPVLLFCIVLFIILLVPVLFHKLNVPAIIGLIITGMIVGPNGFYLLERDASIILFGTVGLLYIMFLAGLEVNLNDFKKNRNKSLVFGFFTFFIPMLLGFPTFYYLLGTSIESSLLISSFFASHTLLAYPVASKLGITKNTAVNVAVGGTIITDTAALLVLAIIAGSAEGELDSEFWITLGLSVIVFGLIVLVGFPFIGRWFFRKMEDSVSQYIFVLGMVFLAAFLAELAGIEPIIGAFLAGLALNRLIPHTSPLMNRIEFVGNAIFIPFFLISVGMLIDLTVLLEGTTAIIIAITMVILALSSKWIAAMVTQKIYKFKKEEGNVIFGLSSAQAAATLAAVLVGFELNLVDHFVLNGTIIMILVTCIVSSYVTERSGKIVALSESRKVPNLKELPERILVPVANPEQIEKLIDLAIMIKDPSSKEPIYPLAVVKDDDEAKEKIALINKSFEKAIKQASATENQLNVLTRVDLNVANGISRAIKEKIINKIIIGWNAKITTTNRVFGSVLDSLLRKTEQSVIVSKIVFNLSTVKRFIVVVPKNAQYETGFIGWIQTIRFLAQQTGEKVRFFGNDMTLNAIKALIQDTKPHIKTDYNIFEKMEDFLVLSRDINKNDLIIIISARKGSLSYDSTLDKVPQHLSTYFVENNFLIIYPEQGSSNKFEIKSLS
jgi:Kef-type K+ transport system membrane component KefB